MRDKYQVQNYVVAYLDVVGQGDALRSITGSFPPSSKEQVESLRLQLVKTAGFIETLRDQITKFFANHSSLLVDGIADVPNEIRQQVECKINAVSYGLSDSFILAVPLYGKNAAYEDLVSVYHALMAVAGVMVAAMARGHAIRGGIDVGLCTRLANGEVYGAALATAVDLERHAKWPRVAVSGQLLSLVHSYSHSTPPVQKEPLVRKAEAIIALLLSRDSDGQLILDYAGKGFADGGPDYSAHIGVHEAVKFARHSLADSKANGGQHQDKYQYLVDYLEARLNLWPLRAAGTAS